MTEHTLNGGFNEITMCDLTYQFIVSPCGGAVTGGPKWANDCRALCVTYLVLWRGQRRQKQIMIEPKSILKFLLWPVC